MKQYADVSTWLWKHLEQTVSGALLQDLQGSIKGVRELPRNFYSAYGNLALRHFDQTPLSLTSSSMVEANGFVDGWQPQAMTVLHAARLLLMLETTADPAVFHERAEQIFRIAEMEELVMLYRALPLFPDPPRWRARAAEGLRTNMRTVFEAVAHDNPYPAAWLDEQAWNQLVIKALFTGSGLHRIHGLDKRRNPALSRALIDYASERRSAGRTVSPWLWRCVAAYDDVDAKNAMKTALDKGDQPEQVGVALALRDFGAESTKDGLLLSYPHLVEEARQRSWTDVL